MRTQRGSAVRSTLFLYAHLLLLPLMAACQPDSTAQAGGELTASAEPVAAEPSVASVSSVEEGRYLVEIAGCNDCHTEGFMVNPAVPEAERLKGSVVGFRGPWGTSYAKNLRFTAASLTEDAWVERLKGQGLPPMPWPSVNAMSEADARAVYRYIRSLGEPGEAMPLPLAPGVEPTTPWFDFEPKMPATVAGS